MVSAQIRRFLLADDGPTAVEYGVALFLVLVFFAGVVAALRA